MSNSALGLSDRVRNRDNSAGLAGKGRDKKPRELKGRMKPVEATDETNFVGADGIDDALETDPDFPPSKIRLAAHTLTPPDLIKQISSFRATGFKPVAVSRLVNLHPEDIQTLAPLDTYEPPTPSPIPRRPAHAGRYSAAAAAKGPARKPGRPKAKK